MGIPCQCMVGSVSPISLFLGLEALGSLEQGFP